MNAAARLGLFGVGLVAVFGLAAAAAGALAPDGIATPAATETAASQEEQDMKDHNAHGGAGHGASAGADAGHGAGHLGGLALADGGFVLDAVAAPASVGEQGSLSFRILGADGAPVTAYDVAHEKELHLIVVRTDGAHFRHVHPERAADGTWSLPWSWDAAGSYRLFADFTASGAEPVTLARTIDVAGDLRPVDPQPTAHATVDGYDLHLSGELAAGAASELTITVSRGGEPVTELEPYLGAFGHLVALRQGDLGYAHVHPEGDEPEPGDTSGPEVRFAATVPTDGRYLLYFDFQIGGVVRSVPFVVDTVGAAASGGEDAGHGHGGTGHDDGGDTGGDSGHDDTGSGDHSH
ncbi:MULTISPECIES: heavy-metal-associated domain-containing protein [Microbacterium]|uniref:heavy-metal-associated domain-containing protein n=1 Tax=Microbacterium TaxID=33882 RepID=UPI00217D0E83|nr:MULTISPECIES: heavy-metal-associated domain-containing protein [Microbacterium]UWF77644.1 heavy-metal-associated domain-containing protein [Microbacterium neungamense]WCM55813.1 heavy-metal-associated domain-containing protein [Microbacterium sp. EF45047]